MFKLCLLTGFIGVCLGVLSDMADFGGFGYNPVPRESVSTIADLAFTEGYCRGARFALKTKDCKPSDVFLEMKIDSTKYSNGLRKSLKLK